jgi:hypothetical protein
MKHPALRSFVLLLGALAMVVTGCGGGSTAPPPFVNVAISPQIVAIDQGQSLNFTASTSDLAGKGVNWSSPGPGTLSNATSTGVTYNAPNSMGSAVMVTITATSVSNPADSTAEQFSVTPMPMITGSLPNGNVGAAYSQAIQVTGGTGSFAFNITSGALPPGLSLSGGVISGIPLAPAQNYNFAAQVADASPAGTVTSPTANLSINIGPPLPLTISTQPSLPTGNVGFSYNVNGVSLSATGGVQPYTFNLAPASDPLPSGLTLTNNNNSGVISGTPTTAGTTNSIIIEVTDAQPVTSPTETYGITVNPSTSFVGTQAPGDVWQLLFSHNDPTDGVLKATDQGAGGLPGTPSTTLTRQFSVVNAGFRRYIVRSLFGQILGYAVEMQGEMVVMQPSPKANGSNVVAGVANSCLQLPTPLPATATYQFVTLPAKTFAMTDTAYGNMAVTQTAANSYNLTVNRFQLNGTANGSDAFPNVSCDTFQDLSFTGTSGSPTTMAFSGHGAVVIDNGTGIPAVGLQRPASNLSPDAILAGQYLGVIFRPNAQAVISTAVPQITQMFGFGPNSGTTLTGGTYGNIQLDQFSAHGTDHVITLGTQTSPGLFTTGGTLQIGTNTISDFDVVAGQVNRKFVLYGIALDTGNSSSPQPTAVLLIQQ